jgi:predicted Rossmann fold nucleotide-binding protein DprA/Smf involved in DNA uptake
MPHHVRKIISGGQTGVDRAALDVAIELGIPHGGWCPLGRLAEDGALAPHYQLQECESADYALRTKRNVISSTATLIVARGARSGGTLLTEQFSQKHGRPCFVVDLNRDSGLSQIRHWLGEQRVSILNVAGPRESSSPGIYGAARSLLLELFDEVTGTPFGRD